MEQAGCPPAHSPEAHRACAGRGGDYRNATITVTKYNDRNGNHQQDVVEPTLQGRTVFVDANGNGTLDTGETMQVTGSNGQAKHGSRTRERSRKA